MQNGVTIASRPRSEELGGERGSVSATPAFQNNMREMTKLTATRLADEQGILGINP